MEKPKLKPNMAASDAHQVRTEKQEQNGTDARYVVIRDGHRVSDNEYDAVDDPRAVTEFRFWKKVATKHSWGETVEVAEYDNKLHRVW